LSRTGLEICVFPRACDWPLSCGRSIYPTFISEVCEIFEVPTAFLWRFSSSGLRVFEKLFKCSSTLEAEGYAFL
jgi:hypothetical protein